MTRWTPGRILSLMRWAALVLFIIGLARPQHVESETTVRASGVDIVTALDLSTSMAAEDPGFTIKREQVNRLEVAKDVLKRFVEKRSNDRIGLVAFAGRAYIAAPLTLDHDFLIQNIDRLNFGLIEDGTAIGSGLSAAVNRLQELKSKSKIVILMTDGQNNAGKVPPITAAEAAQALNVKVYTIGVGTRGMGRMPVTDVFGRKRYQPMPVDIDEKTLTEIAQKTGGKYLSRGQQRYAAKNLRGNRQARAERSRDEEIRPGRGTVQVGGDSWLAAPRCRGPPREYHLEETALMRFEHQSLLWLAFAGGARARCILVVGVAHETAPA